MAAGSIPRVSVKGSDDYYSFTCTLCFRKGRNTGAEVYCVQCEEYLCKVCLDSHNSFAKMAVHTLEDRDQMEAKGPQRAQPLLTVPCEQHPGQVYSLYCSKHDKVCCPVCSQVNHKLCDVVYIPDVLRECKPGDELQEFKRVTMKVQATLKSLLEKRRKDLENLTEERDREVDKIQNTIKEMIAAIRIIENSAIDDVVSKFKEFKVSIEGDLSKIEMAMKALDDKLDKLEKASDEAQQFVHIKNAMGTKSNGNDVIEDIEAHSGKECLIYIIDKQIEEFVKKIQSLGKLVVDCKYSATAAGKHRVDTKQDEKNCSIGDICLTDENTMLMTDWNNKCLKRFDSSFKLIDRLKLDCEPWGVCSVPAEQAAATLYNDRTVQILTLGKIMVADKSFKTPDRCRGIKCHKKHLYVSCGGWVSDGEGPGHIAVYSISGTLLRKIETDSKGSVFSSRPLGVAVRSAYDDVILVCDRDNGLVAIGDDGERRWTVTCEDLQVDKVSLVIVDSHGQALVSSYRSNKVVLVSRNGRKLDELLTASDGIKELLGLCFDTQRSRLMAGMEASNQIGVFSLK